MRNRVLNLGVAILALSSLPSCTTEPANEANDVSEVGLAENLEAPSAQAGEPSLGVQAEGVKSTEDSSSNEDLRNGVIDDKAITPSLACGLTPYSGGHCYLGHNCHDYRISRRIVKTNGNRTGCFSIPPGGILSDCLTYGLVWYWEGC